MEFETFSGEITGRLQELLGRGYQIKRQEMTGLNGVVKQSLAVLGEGQNVCPCIDMGDCYNRYRSGTGIDGIVDRILKECRKEPPFRMEEISAFSQWESVKGRIYARLINTGQNEALLRKLPHRQYLDLSLVYYVCMDGEAGECGIVQVHREHMERWGVQEEALFGQAWGNLWGISGVMLEDMEDILNGYTDVGKPLYTDGMENKMYVLGRKERVNGAVYIYSRDVLCAVGELLGGDFWVLPSSIHETILMPVGKRNNDAQHLAEIVREINDTQLSRTEILSYHVYRYCKERGELVIAA